MSKFTNWCKRLVANMTGRTIDKIIQDEPIPEKVLFEDLETRYLFKMNTKLSEQKFGLSSRESGRIIKSISEINDVLKIFTRDVDASAKCLDGISVNWLEQEFPKVIDSVLITGEYKGLKADYLNFCRGKFNIVINEYLESRHTYNIDAPRKCIQHTP